MLQLGIVTYNIAKDWDLATILKRLDELDYEGVELRTSHAHKVEVDLSASQRREIKQRFADSPVELAGLGSAFEYQSTDPAVVKKNIEGTKAYVRLAHDLGSPGVKVRPNGIPKGADLDATSTSSGHIRENFEISTLPEDAMKEIAEGITTRCRFNTVVETGVPGFIARGR
ncbi:sugar phosphate isomerase/epimerase family protein [Singulisphaera rosea]